MLGGETTAAPKEKSREMKICGYGVYMVWEQGLRLGSAFGMPGQHQSEGMVYKCFGRSSRCSGGPAGSCAPGRDPETVT